MTGTDIAISFPDIAARLVANPQADTHNAWIVLRSAWGHDKALDMVLAEDGGREALQKIGVIA